MREGLARLERIGIVSKARNRGVSVRSFTAEEVRQIYDVREILQRQAALRIRLPVDPVALHRLNSINAEYESAAENGEFQRIHETNDRFHMELFRLCGNDLLAQLVKNYMDLTYVIRGSGFTHPRQPRDLTSSPSNNAQAPGRQQILGPWLKFVWLTFSLPSRTILLSCVSRSTKVPENESVAQLVSCRKAAVRCPETSGRHSCSWLRTHAELRSKSREDSHQHLRCQRKAQSQNLHLTVENAILNF